MHLRWGLDSRKTRFRLANIGLACQPKPGRGGAGRLRQGYGASAPSLARHGRAGRRMERVTRLELATSSLARRCSTTELHPRLKGEGIMSTASRDARFLSAVAAPLCRRTALCPDRRVITATERRRYNFAN